MYSKLCKKINHQLKGLKPNVFKIALLEKCQAEFGKLDEPKKVKEYTRSYILISFRIVVLNTFCGSAIP